MEQSLILRNYQQRIINATRESLKKNKRLLVYAPQGSGKSVLAGFMAANAVRKDNRILILTHREEILRQNFDKIGQLNLHVEIVHSRISKLSEARIYCAMTQTVAARCKRHESWRRWMKDMTMVIVDEAHRSEHDVLYKYLDPSAWIIGLSASLLRTGTMTQLGSIYSDIVNVIETQELVSLKYLTPSKNYAFQAPKLDDVTINRGTGDYVQQKLQRVFRKKERYAGVISNYKAICPEAKAIVFTTGAVHCIELCKEFNAAGIAAKYLISKPYPETDAEYSGDRETLLKDFSCGVFKVLLNISMLDTGVDVPSIEAVILDFSTTSYVKYAQCVGRGSRIYPGKSHFYVLDFGSNINSFGIYEDKPLMSLWHNAGGTGVAMTKECPITRPDLLGKMGCGRLIPISVQDCPFCGYHFATDREVYEVELREVLAKQKEDTMSITEWAAQKALEGWTLNRILCAVMTKNPDNMKQAFEEARQVLRTADGKTVSPTYYHFVKKHLLKRK